MSPLIAMTSLEVEIAIFKRGTSFASLEDRNPLVSFLFLMTREKFQCVSMRLAFSCRIINDVVGRPGRRDANCRDAAERRR